MKILIIHNSYGKFSGEEAVVNAQIELLKSNGHTVLTYFKSSSDIDDTLRGKAKAFFTAFYNKKVIQDILKLIHTHSPDIVHIHNLYPLLSPAFLPEVKKKGIPIVMTVHNYRLMCPNGLFYNNGAICEKCTGFGKEMHCIINNCEDSLFKSTGYALRNMWARTHNYYLNNVDKYLCLTDFQKKKLVNANFSKKDCVIIPNMYSKKFNSVAYNLEDRNYVAFAGRISPEKGIPILLEAARQLPEITFQLAGSLRKGYKNELNIPDNVILRGMLNAKEMEDFYAHARLYLHTSVCYEGFPMVFPEAMAFKLPIIAPNMAGYPEIAEHNFNGVLYKPNNSKHLVEVIKNLWSDNSKLEYLSANGFKKVKQNYSASTYYKLLMHTYKSILKTN